MKKTKMLRTLLNSNKTEFIMEAHNGISAKIVEEAGFSGIWGSGLTISASHGVRDNNELSWTQVLSCAEFMSDITEIPILLDGDTGYGNFNNMRRLIKKLEQINIAGVCIEDKIFPKTNSFIRGEKQPLADIEEFCGKIKAGKDAQIDNDFCIVARTESLITGYDMEVALERADRYYNAGADAILIHSKISKADEIIDFMNSWHKKCPVVIVPTKYYSTPTKVFEDVGISLVIWANHLLRASIKAMQHTTKEIYTSQSLIYIEDKVATLAEVFRLQNDVELQEAENLYLKKNDSMNAIILASNRGEEFGELTESIPKSMLKVNGKPILEKLITMFQDAKISDISVIRGYKKESINYPEINLIDNDKYQETGELYSLIQAKNKIKGDCIITYGDIVLRKFILNNLIQEAGDIVVVVDSLKSPGNGKLDHVKCSEIDSDLNSKNDIFLNSMEFSEQKSSQDYDGEWIGMLKTSTSGSKILVKALEELEMKDNFYNLNMSDLFSHLISFGVKIKVIYIHGNWVDMDNIKDYVKGSNLLF